MDKLIQWKSHLLGGSILCCALAISGNAVFAQSIETYDAPIKRGATVGTLPTPKVELSKDGTPLGARLMRLEIVNPRENAGDNSYRGKVDLSRAGRILQTAELRKKLAPYIGRKMSKKLIFDIRALITNYFRSKDRPLVSVIIPPQEVTKGTLRLTVLPFQLGSKRTEGNQWTPDEHITRAISQKVGREIDGGRLIADVNWLNRNPYRDSKAIFEPGTEPGTTDIIIRSEERRPWSAYMGYANSGSNTDDPHRLFAGFNAVNFPLTDAQLSYQFTGSPISMAEGRLFSLNKEIGFLSHSGSLWMPLPLRSGAHHAINLRMGYTESFTETNQFFEQENMTYSFYGDYGISLPNSKGILPEVYAGIDFKRQYNNTYFLSLLSRPTIQDIINGIIGIRGNYIYNIGNAKTTKSATGNFDLKLVFSPGDNSEYNTDAAFIAASSDPQATASYTYIAGNGSINVPLRSGFSFSGNLQGQLAFGRLPGAERFRLGGSGSVRGYLSGERTGDSGVAMQAAIYAPAQKILKGRGLADALVGYIFTDFGATSLTTDLGDELNTLASVGFGANYQLGSNFTSSFNFGYALMDGESTEQGDFAITGRATFKY